MHHFKAKGGTFFNFNSDMSGDVHIHRDRMIAAVVSGDDLLEFAGWYDVEYAGVSSEPTLDWLWMVTDPSPVSELGDILFQPGDRLQDWCVGGAVRGDPPAVTLYDDEVAAKADAVARIAKRDETVGTVEIRGSSDPTKLGEVLYKLLKEAAGQQVPVSSDDDALRELADAVRFAEAGWLVMGDFLDAEATLRALIAKLPEKPSGSQGVPIPSLDPSGTCTHPPGCTFCSWCGFVPPKPPTRRPARDVAHDILEKSGWSPCGMSLTEAADAIVAIIRADRKGE